MSRRDGSCARGRFFGAPKNRPLAHLAAVALLPLLLVGCTAEGPRDSAGQITTSAPSDAFSLQVGDCTDALTSGSVGRVVLVPCAQPHAWEAFATTELRGDQFPGAGAVQDQSDEFCGERFKSFVGAAVDKSQYDLTMLQPTKQTWTDAADRTVTCLVGKADGQFVGSLAGAKK